MDKKSIIGLVLIVGILIIYSVLTKPSKEQLAIMKRQQDSITQVQQQTQAKQQLLKATTDTLAAKGDSIRSQIPDSAKTSALQSKYGVFVSAVKDTNEFITIENSLLKIKLSAKGGRPYSVELKKYKRYDKKPLILFDGDSTVFGLNFFSQNKSIATNDLFFKPVNNKKSVEVTNNADSVSLRLYAGDNSYIEYVYTVKPNDYMIKFNVNFVNMDNIIAVNSKTIDFNWAMYVPHQEKGAKNENRYTNIQYKHFEDEDESFSATKQEEKKEVATKMKWIAFKQQFFSSVIIAGDGFNNTTMQSVMMSDSSKYLKHYATTIALNYDSRAKYSVPMNFYFGPNHYPTLKKYNLGLEHMVYLGWSFIRWINQIAVIPIFNILSNFIANFGIIILLLTIIIKTVLFPLTFKSYQSQAKMRVLKPQVDEINAKIPKEKAMERQQAVMALYKKVGVNPMGGCLPMLLQIPILFAMFSFFPTSIELRQQGFLWATDLSSYDSIFSWTAQIPLISQFYGNHISLFTILMTITTIISMKMSQTAATDNQMPGMKTIMYIMPVMFMFMLNNFSSGLTYYYFLANVITIGQNELFKRMIDEQKLLKQIHANKAKVVKKSKFQERLEKMARERGLQTPKK
ncbi:MAG: membrane protein insertase YidC [Bacteroidota bacterium]|nr:membrane protein insertase YidC [Bacteroidota bacterium]